MKYKGTLGKLALLLLLPIFLNVGNLPLWGQVTGETPVIPDDQDGTIIFEPARPLFTTEVRKLTTSAWGFELLFSSSGFGMGVFVRKELSQTWFLLYHLGISGARNTDEFEVYDWRTGTWFVPGKVNRLYSLPLTVGIQKRLFSESLAMGLEPYIQAGVGASMIVATPYEQDFFSAFGDAAVFGRFAGYVGIGANFGNSDKGILGANIRYYYIPFGGEGIESIAGLPMSNFGGVFLSLHFGFKY